MTPYRSPGLTLAALAALGLLAAAHPAHANTNIVVNGSFEDLSVKGINKGGSATGTDSVDFAYRPSGDTWTYTGNSGLNHPDSDFNNSYALPTGYDGSQYAFLQTASIGTNTTISHGNGSIYQTLTLTAGTQYNYSFLAAGRPGFKGDTTDTISLVQAEGSSSTLQTFTTESTNQTFTDYTGSFTVNTSGKYDFTITNITNATKYGDETSFIDKVNVSAAPEPSQLAGLAFTGFGALGLILKTRKRKTSEVAD